MPDREKVIREFRNWCDAMADECPVICIHVLDMLKEQEAEVEWCERCGRVRLKSKWEGR